MVSLLQLGFFVWRVLATPLTKLGQLQLRFDRFLIAG